MANTHLYCHTDTHILLICEAVWEQNSEQESCKFHQGILDQKPNEDTREHLKDKTKQVHWAERSCFWIKCVYLFCYQVEQSLRVGVQLQYSKYTTKTFYFLDKSVVVRGCDMQILVPNLDYSLLSKTGHLTVYYIVFLFTQAKETPCKTWKTSKINVNINLWWRLLHAIQACVIRTTGFMFSTWLSQLLPIWC